ncbi:hypothetical protein ACFRQM_21995 [Streptomyces sp. NPDC056831]|uniref:hypothetical protein n=1 Tax=Streptomyces sp. NPDC056831 TaxID=3345954 RepID=UPI003673C74F
MPQSNVPALRLTDRASRKTEFDENDLRAPAGPRSFERGQGYVDAVTATEVGDG